MSIKDVKTGTNLADDSTKAKREALVEAFGKLTDEQQDTMLELVKKLLAEQSEQKH